MPKEEAKEFDRFMLALTHRVLNSSPGSQEHELLLAWRKDWEKDQRKNDEAFERAIKSCPSSDIMTFYKSFSFQALSQSPELDKFKAVQPDLTKTWKQVNPKKSDSYCQTEVEKEFRRYIKRMIRYHRVDVNSIPSANG